MEPALVAELARVAVGTAESADYARRVCCHGHHDAMATEIPSRRFDVVNIQANGDGIFPPRFSSVPCNAASFDRQIGLTESEAGERVVRRFFRELDRQANHVAIEGDALPIPLGMEDYAASLDRNHVTPLHPPLQHLAQELRELLRVELGVPRSEMAHGLAARGDQIDLAVLQVLDRVG